MSKLSQFQKICLLNLQLFAQKNEQYGNTIVETGVLGASVELVGAVARLKKMVLKSGDGGKSNREALIDIFMDIHNYANIALMMLEEDNFTGVENNDK